MYGILKKTKQLEYQSEIQRVMMILVGCLHMMSRHALHYNTHNDDDF